ncbi:hypothetical protein BGZ51_000201 [Haplosporangium sp. Z 767]|nr:hypothetical protein BGZ51_000201 [Haplosporangium sp. Z 767]KAF9190147.1 hypothetical protein BGZ50_000360 [Haplosporangium sp. Z 11]
MLIARWAFNIRQPLLLEHIEPLVTSLTSDDTPNIVPVSNLLSFLPTIECDRLLQFRTEDDMRRALVGRLLIHAFFAAHHGCRWDELVFTRSEKNKPVLVEPERLREVSFNVAHHGDWVVFVGNTSPDNSVHLGVDTMDFQEQVPGESFEVLSACFLEQFTPNEIAFMKDAPLDPEAPTSTNNNLRRFYRMWCLKEATVKSLGIGIDCNLKSFEFVIQDTEETTEPILTTTLRVLEPSSIQLEDNWCFEEALLDNNHCYAIAARVETGSNDSVMDGTKIMQFDWQRLLRDAVPYPLQFV